MEFTRWNGTVVREWEEYNDLEKIMFKGEELKSLMQEVRDCLISVRMLLESIEVKGRD